MRCDEVSGKGKSHLMALMISEAGGGNDGVGFSGVGDGSVDGVVMAECDERSGAAGHGRHLAEVPAEHKASQRYSLRHKDIVVLKRWSLFVSWS